MPNNCIDHFDDHGNMIPGLWREEVPQGEETFNVTREDNVLSYTTSPRNILLEYFLSPVGRVPWQDEHATHGF